MPQRVRMFLDGLVRLAALLSRVGDVADRPYCRLWAVRFFTGLGSCLGFFGSWRSGVE